MTLPALSVIARPRDAACRRPPRRARARARQPPALAELFRRYARYVATIGFKLLGRDDELDDLVQDVFIEAHRGLHQLRDLDAAKAGSRASPCGAPCAGCAARSCARSSASRRWRSRPPLVDDAATPEERAHIALDLSTARGAARAAADRLAPAPRRGRDARLDRRAVRLLEGHGAAAAARRARSARRRDAIVTRDEGTSEAEAARDDPCSRGCSRAGARRARRTTSPWRSGASSARARAPAGGRGRRDAGRRRAGVVGSGGRRRARRSAARAARARGVAAPRRARSCPTARGSRSPTRARAPSSRLGVAAAHSTSSSRGAARGVRRARRARGAPSSCGRRASRSRSSRRGSTCGPPTSASRSRWPRVTSP